MATLHVRELSDTTMAALKVRAAQAGQSVQAYVRMLLDVEANTLSPSEAANRARDVAARATISADDVIEAIAQARRSRE